MGPKPGEAIFSKYESRLLISITTWYLSLKVGCLWSGKSSDFADIGVQVKLKGSMTITYVWTQNHRARQFGSKSKLPSSDMTEIISVICILGYTQHNTEGQNPTLLESGFHSYKLGGRSSLVCLIHSPTNYVLNIWGLKLTYPNLGTF